MSLEEENVPNFATLDKKKTGDFNYHSQITKENNHSIMELNGDVSKRYDINDNSKLDITRHEAYTIPPTLNNNTEHQHSVS